MKISKAIGKVMTTRDMKQVTCYLGRSACVLRISIYMDVQFARDTGHDDYARGVFCASL